MEKRLAKIADTLRQIGDIQINEWDFMSLLNKDIRDFEFARSLRKLGNIRVIEWDFRYPFPSEKKSTPKLALLEIKPQKPEDTQTIIDRLKRFLQYVAVNLIDEPKHAQIKIQEIAPKVYRFKLVLVQRDVAMLIGREGHTASAIRNLLKEAARTHGIHALLEIHSHEDEMNLNHDPTRS